MIIKGDIGAQSFSLFTKWGVMPFFLSIRGPRGSLVEIWTHEPDLWDEVNLFPVLRGYRCWPFFWVIYQPGATEAEIEAKEVERRKRLVEDHGSEEAADILKRAPRMNYYEQDYWTSMAR